MILWPRSHRAIDALLGIWKMHDGMVRAVMEAGSIGTEMGSVYRDGNFWFG